MFHWLQRHPFPVVARFDHCLVLTYALPADALESFLPPGLVLDTYCRDGEQKKWGFLAIALVQTRALRPAGCPHWLGRDFFLSGYRIFARFHRPRGGTLRGLRILRSDTDSVTMATAGNLLTHYNYRHSNVRLSASTNRLELTIDTLGSEADLHVVAHLEDTPAPLPAESCFDEVREARRFAGPLPYTFDYEPETRSIVAIKATRDMWKPKPVRVDVVENTFLEHRGLDRFNPILASAFYLRDVPYCWQRGVRYPLVGMN